MVLYLRRAASSWWPDRDCGNHLHVLKDTVLSRQELEMAGLYANKFTVEINDVARIVFIDERAPLKPGLPMASVTAAEVVMTHANLVALGEIIKKHADKFK